ncbi:NAD(P)/FAD-dependent oxidoreductase [Streptomyces sp. NPDC059718]
MSTSAQEADVIVVGAGPAGVSAAVMAASLGLRTTVVETLRVGSKLHLIGALENVMGGWATGPQLADALINDLDRLQQAGRCSMMNARAISASANEDYAELVLSDGHALTAGTIIVATGVAALTPVEAAWIRASEGLQPNPLWRATPADLTGYTYVLGADRPLGTWLRAHPTATAKLHVLVPPGDDYKAAEVAHDERVRLVSVDHVNIAASTLGAGWTVDVTDRAGQRKVYAVDTLLTNLGNRPAALEGLERSADGYCPTSLQHPRIRIAGDLRSAQYQRIATAQGSGAEAVLASYYASALQGA